MFEIDPQKARNHFDGRRDKSLVPLTEDLSAKRKKLVTGPRCGRIKGRDGDGRLTRWASVQARSFE